MDGARPIWILERVSSPRFPYRVRVVRGEETLLALRAQDKWPVAGANYFCLHDTGPREDDGPEPPVEVERVPVVSFDRYGRRLAVALDRGRFKRCDFLFLEKDLKGRPGERYEQIFWRTETALRQRRPTKKLTLGGRTTGLEIVVDSRERYGWTFPGCTVERRALAVGDYGLLMDGELVAVVERKTEDNLLAEFGRMPVFHQILGQLEKIPGHAFVIEADYARILDPKRWPQYTPAFRAKAVAENDLLRERLERELRARYGARSERSSLLGAPGQGLMMFLADALAGPASPSPSAAPPLPAPEPRPKHGRKNWMFAGSDEGGRRAAIIYSVIATCKANDVEPWAYLREVLERLPTYRGDIAALAPAAWKSGRASGAAVPPA